MLVKSRHATDHLRDLKETFQTLRQYNMKLNPAKCAFGVASGKFLGFLVNHWGIEVDPRQISAIQNLQAPKNAKEVQKLTKMAAALNRFISRSLEKCRSFFQLLKKKEQFQWTSDCDKVLVNLKQYLMQPPVLLTSIQHEELFLYLAISEHAVSAVLLQ